MTVTKDGDTYDFVCPVCGFMSRRWATKAAASARAKQHATEHETGKPMPELADFEREG